MGKVSKLVIKNAIARYVLVGPVINSSNDKQRDNPYESFDYS